MASRDRAGSHKGYRVSFHAGLSASGPQRGSEVISCGLESSLLDLMI